VRIPSSDRGPYTCVRETSAPSAPQWGIKWEFISVHSHTTYGRASLAHSYSTGPINQTNRVTRTVTTEAVPVPVPTSTDLWHRPHRPRPTDRHRASRPRTATATATATATGMGHGTHRQARSGTVGGTYFTNINSYAVWLYMCYMHVHV
jgi:hypothetical protein